MLTNRKQCKFELLYSPISFTLETSIIWVTDLPNCEYCMLMVQLLPYRAGLI